MSIGFGLCNIIIGILYIINNKKKIEWYKFKWYVKK